MAENLVKRADLMNELDSQPHQTMVNKCRNCDVPPKIKMEYCSIGQCVRGDESQDCYRAAD